MSEQILTLQLDTKSPKKYVTFANIISYDLISPPTNNRSKGHQGGSEDEYPAGYEGNVLGGGG